MTAAVQTSSRGLPAKKGRGAGGTGSEGFGGIFMWSDDADRSLHVIHVWMWSSRRIVWRHGCNERPRCANSCCARSTLAEHLWQLACGMVQWMLVVLARRGIKSSGQGAPSLTKPTDN